MIRKAETRDSSRIADIQVFGWRNAYRGIVNDLILFSKLNIEKKSQKVRESIEENKEEWYVFDEEEIIKGIMMLGPSRDKDKEGSFELWCIYVDPLMLRNGIGREMLEYCETEAKNRRYKENMLWLLKENKIGRNFYEKNGYKTDGNEQLIESLGVIEIRYAKELEN